MFVWRLIPAALALGLSACGGSDPSGAVLSGTVRSASGAAVANAEVVVMNRQSNQRHTAMTDELGDYRLHLPNGHYDVGAEDGQHQEATIVSLVSVAGSDRALDIDLPEPSDTWVMGTIRTQDQQPAANYTVILSSTDNATSRGDWVNMRTTTDADGAFRFDLGSERFFDLDIEDANGELVEFIDLHKLDGGLKLIITLGDASNRNVHRHNTGPALVETAGVKPASGLTNQAFEVVSDYAEAKSEAGGAGGNVRRPSGSNVASGIDQCFHKDIGSPHTYCYNVFTGGRLERGGDNMLVKYASQDDLTAQKKNIGLRYLNAQNGLVPVALATSPTNSWFASNTSYTVSVDTMNDSDLDCDYYFQYNGTVLAHISFSKGTPISNHTARYDSTIGGVINGIKTECTK